MPVRFHGNEPEYVGCVIGTFTHCWLDGMVEDTAIVWDMEAHERKNVQFGYYGIDGSNLAGGVASVDLCSKAARDIIKTRKESFIRQYNDMMKKERARVAVGREAVVVRGTKVKKGTVLKVFWIGERETYMSRMYSYRHEYETIAGCYDKDGNKVWIKVDYLKNISEVPSPTAKERRSLMNRYVFDNLEPIVARAARKEIS